MTKLFIKTFEFDKAKLWADQILTEKAKVNSTAVLEMKEEVAKLIKDIETPQKAGS